MVLSIEPFSQTPPLPFESPTAQGFSPPSPKIGLGGTRRGLRGGPQSPFPDVPPLDGGLQGQAANGAPFLYSPTATGGSKDWACLDGGSYFLDIY